MKTCTICNLEKEEARFRQAKGSGRRRANCRTCDSVRHKAWRIRNREHLRRYDRQRWRKTDRWNQHIWRRYGISVADYNAMLQAQDGKCAICNSCEAGGNSVRFHVDHDHASGSVRGLLCSRCNRLIGAAEESGTILGSALRYLRASARRKPKPSSAPTGN
jgi:hypothetical protein